MKYPADYQAKPNLLANKVILVTGAGDGIGKATAITAAEHGATVVLVGKTVSKLEATYDEIEKLGAPTPAIYPINLEGASPQDYDQLAQTLRDNFSRLDGIVHNAVQMPYLSRLKDYESTDWVKVMHVNVTAAFMLTQACLELLEETGNSSVIFSTDDVGHSIKPFYGAYAASKHAIESLALTWAEEMSHTSVRFNLLNPGITLTPMRKRLFPGEDNAALTPPAERAKAYLWLLSDDTQGISGTLVNCN